MTSKESTKFLVGTFFLGVLMMAPFVGIVYLMATEHRDVDGYAFFIVASLAFGGSCLSYGALCELFERATKRKT